MYSSVILPETVQLSQRTVVTEIVTARTKINMFYIHHYTPVHTGEITVFVVVQRERERERRREREKR